MRKVILQEFISLDSLAAGPNDSVDYVRASTQGDKSFGEEQFKLMNSVDTILLGRVTYQMFAGHWPVIRTNGYIQVPRDQRGSNRHGCRNP
jgi:dihydrofolate reductase